MEFPVWRQRLRAAQQREGRSPSARWLQLASVALDGTARVRTLVFRGWTGDRQLNLYTDQRSAKCDELNLQPHVELCWLMPKAKQQYRLRGVIHLQSPDQRLDACQQAWTSLTNSGRALWFWPPPGLPFQTDADFPEKVTTDQPPDHFLLLQLEITRVELLELGRHPHQRLRWLHQEGGWSEQRLNP